MNPKRTRRRFTAEFKAELVLAARYHLSVEHINSWKSHLRQQAMHVLAEPTVPVMSPTDAEPLYAAIGRLQIKNQLLKKNAASMRVTQQRAVVAASDEGSVKARCQVFLGLTGYSINAKRVRRLVRLMGQESVHSKPHLSVAGRDSMRYPYLLRERVLYAPYEVRSTDIIYVLMAKGVLYLVTVPDWHTRYVLNWELSNTPDVGFRLHTLATHPSPYIFNSNQDSQFTSQFFAQAHCLPAAKSAAMGVVGPLTIPSLRAYGVPLTGNASTQPGH